MKRIKFLLIVTIILLLVSLLVVGFVGCEDDETTGDENGTVHISISCTNLLEFGVYHQYDADQDGYILFEYELSFNKKTTVFAMTALAAENNGIELKFNGSQKLKTAYIISLNGLSEKDTRYGTMTGWKFSVNNEFGGAGASGTKINDGDTIIWHYTTNGSN